MAVVHPALRILALAVLCFACDRDSDPARASLRASATVAPLSGPASEARGHDFPIGSDPRLTPRPPQRRSGIAADLAIAEWRLLVLGTVAAACSLLLPLSTRLQGRMLRGAARVRGLLANGVLFALCLVLGQALDLRSLWLLPTALHGGALALAYGQGALSSARLSREALSLALATLGAAALAIAASTPSALPWQWPLASVSPTWLALLVLAQSEIAGRSEREHTLVDVTGPWLAYARAALVATFALGGAALPSALRLEGRALTFVALVVLLAKVELARWLLERLACVRLHTASALACALGAPLLALVWSRLFDGSALAHMLGAIVVGACAGRFARTLLVRVWRPVSTCDPALAPLV